MKQIRFYYKSNDGKAIFSLKTPDFKDKEGYEAITEEQFNTIIAEKAV